MVAVALEASDTGFVSIADAAKLAEEAFFGQDA
jgi:hypothetical protein